MISDEFRKNVESGDILTVRSALVDYLIIDRSFKTFDEAFNYASQRIDLIQPYDNNGFVSDSTQWNEAYLNEQKVALMVNFSSERISHIKEVISAIMPSTSITPPRASTPHSSTGKRTGQKKVSETEVINQSPHSSTQTISRSGSQGKSTSRTGTKRTITREIPSDPQGKAKVEEGVGVGMIITGAAVATVGAVAEVPILIGTGVIVAVAGVGVAVKGKG